MGWIAGRAVGFRNAGRISKQRMLGLRHFAALVAVVLAVAPGTAGCSSAHLASNAGSATHAVAAGCGATAMHRGTPPDWTAPAWAVSSGAPTGLPYVIAEHGHAIAFIFGFPLRAGDPTNPANKILWVVRSPRNGSDLVIHARPLHASMPVITIRQAANSGPGEIYPSYVNVPAPGCWQMTLHWNGRADSIDLAYRAAKRR
jgi:hypothetical protein